MTAEQNKVIVRRIFEELVSKGDMSVADELFASDFVWPQFGLHGPEGVKEWVRAFRSAFPDVYDTVDEQIAEGNKVMSCVTVKGTNLGQWYGLPPTGKSAVWSAVGIDRLADGKIVERYAVFDLAGVMRQLGHEVLMLQRLEQNFKR